ncbi:MAG TPA: hypothetical protein VHL50_07915, partial [Pyrinomonadaceae bacterium]|nr:hypothetical protein [Pyrinomonadaceae bacterium]
MSRLYACIISPNAAADEVDLLSIAYGFAYRVERLDDGVLFDVTGLEKLVGNHKAVAREVLKELKKKNLSGNVAVAETIESALVLARQHGGLNHTAATSEKFHQTQLQNLDIDPDTLNVFRSLGIDN